MGRWAVAGEHVLTPGTLSVDISPLYTLPVSVTVTWYISGDITRPIDAPSKCNLPSVHLGVYNPPYLRSLYCKLPTEQVTSFEIRDLRVFRKWLQPIFRALSVSNTICNFSEIVSHHRFALNGCNSPSLRSRSVYLTLVTLLAGVTHPRCTRSGCPGM